MAPPLPAGFRDFIPLSVDELEVLRAVTYEKEASLRGRWKTCGKKLLDMGLLEKNPTATGFVVRRTTAGTDEARLLRHAEIRSTVRWINEVFDEDREAAENVRESLWQRLLVECALGYVNQALIRTALSARTL